MRSKGALAIADALKEGLHKLKVLPSAVQLLKMTYFLLPGFVSILLLLLITSRWLSPQCSSVPVTESDEVVD